MASWAESTRTTSKSGARWKGERSAAGSRTVAFAWAAGLFEGEGCIAAPAEAPHQIHLSLITTDLDVLMKFHEIVGCGSIAEKVRPANKPHWSDTWVWQAFGDSAENTLRSMMPYLCARRFARASEALAARTAYRETVTRERPCAICGIPFRPKFNANSRISFLCSKPCAAEHKRRYMRARGRTVRA